MSDFYWREQDSFDELCNMVAKGKMVCLTGAGISKSLVNEHNEKLPDWQELLERIYDRMQNEKGIEFEDEKETIDSLLNTECTVLRRRLR